MIPTDALPSRESPRCARPTVDAALTMLRWLSELGVVRILSNAGFDADEQVDVGQIDLPENSTFDTVMLVADTVA